MISYDDGNENSPMGSTSEVVDILEREDSRNKDITQGCSSHDQQEEEEGFFDLNPPYEESPFNPDIVLSYDDRDEDEEEFWSLDDVYPDEEEEIDDLSPIYEHDPDNPDRLRDIVMPEGEVKEQIDDFLGVDESEEEMDYPEEEDPDPDQEDENDSC
jgi:hypothetical protein